MDSISNLKSEAKSAMLALTEAGVTQSDVAKALNVSQSQVSRLLAGKLIRRSRLFDEICIFAYEAQADKRGDGPTPASACKELTSALDAVWDGSAQHAKVLALVIRSLGGLALARPSERHALLKRGRGRPRMAMAST
jgi:transcriptional regulator with XRE-family HTH domain